MKYYDLRGFLLVKNQSVPKPTFLNSMKNRILTSTTLLRYFALFSS